MDRRDFMGKAGCAAAALVASGSLASGQDKAIQAVSPPPPPPSSRKRYKIDIEIFEAREDTWCHKKGDTFAYPADWGKLCPWLRASLNEFVRLLENGVTLPWRYEGTPYEKVVDPDGVTTEYVRCPDPTSALVAKITRTRV
ncbi:MAG: twin-arginine translocation signal domain-containing protein [Candidatus Aminicenantes bacterium]|nr:twin-arginine translocation signal domain-containing protein [Candidatus Aminicenantes bacterium]NLH76761.1 twin-arginine translocation signal domain-containing protein [Acidobacteriota bacterium]